MNSTDMIRNHYNANDLKLRDAMNYLAWADSRARRVEILTDMANITDRMADQRTLWDHDDDNPGLLESHTARLFRLMALAESYESLGRAVLPLIDPLQYEIAVDSAIYALAQAETRADRVSALVRLAGAVRPHVGSLAASVLHNVAKAYQAGSQATSVLDAPPRRALPWRGLAAWACTVLGVAAAGVASYAVAWMPSTPWVKLGAPGLALLWLGSWLFDLPEPNRNWAGRMFLAVSSVAMVIAFLGWSRWIPAWFAQLWGMPNPLGVAVYAVISMAASVASVVCHMVGARRSS